MLRRHNPRWRYHATPDAPRRLLPVEKAEAWRAAERAHMRVVRRRRRLRATLVTVVVLLAVAALFAAPLLLRR